MKSLKGRGNYNYYAYCATQNDIIPKDKELAAIAITSGFYDELAHKDKTIHQSKDQLNEIKLKGIKESIYSNRNVPLEWKTKLNYRDTVTEAIWTDRPFATYLDHKSPIDDYQLKPMLTSTHQNSSLSVTPHTTNKSFFDRIKSEIPVEKNETRKVTRMNFCSFNLAKKKDIESILEEYRGMFSMKKFIDDYKEKHRSTTEPCLLNATKSNNMTGLSFNSIKGRRKIDKEEVFRSSIYGNLLPGLEEKLTVEEQMLKNQEMLLALKKKPLVTQGEFLNSNTEEYNRKIVITNPKIKKGLEMIDYYGPRYSHCKLCLNKNLEYYQNNEPNQCLELLAYLKKVKNKKKASELLQDPTIACSKQ